MSYTLKAVQPVRELKPNLMGPTTKGVFLTLSQQAFQCNFLCSYPSTRFALFCCYKSHIDWFFSVDEPVRSHRLLIFSVSSPPQNLGDAHHSICNRRCCPIQRTTTLTCLSSAARPAPLPLTPSFGFCNFSWHTHRPTVMWCQVILWKQCQHNGNQSII